MTAMHILAHFAGEKHCGGHLQLSITDHMAYLSEMFFFPGVWEGLWIFSGQLARYHVYATREGGSVALAALEEKFWLKFCQAIGRQELSGIGFDKRKNKQAIMQLEKIFKQHSLTYWRTFSLSHDVCLTVVNKRKTLAKNSFAQQAELIFSGGRRKFYQSRLSARKQHVYKSTGDDNAEIFKKLKISQKTLNELNQKGVI